MTGVSDGVRLFGGIQPGLQNTDTWLWNGTAWGQIATAHAPPPNATEISASPQGGVLALVAPIGSPSCQTYQLSQTDWIAR